MYLTIKYNKNIYNANDFTKDLILNNINLEY